MPAENDTSPKIDFHQGTVRVFGASAEFVNKVLPHIPFMWDGREDCFRTDAMNAMRAFQMKRKIEEHADAKMRTLEDLFRLHCDESVIVFTGSNVMA